MKIILTTTEYLLKEGTKTVYEQHELNKNTEISNVQYKNYIDSCKFFRKAGGSETVTFKCKSRTTRKRDDKGYTSHGYNVIKIVSISPNRKEKIVRTFDFQ